MGGVVLELLQPSFNESCFKEATPPGVSLVLYYYSPVIRRHWYRVLIKSLPNYFS